MSEQDVQAGQMDEAEEVLDVVFPSDDESAEVVHPCKESLDFPASAVTAQLPAVLGLLFAIAAVGSDHLDAVFFCHLVI